jgi:hypothetical protein
MSARSVRPKLAIKGFLAAHFLMKGPLLPLNHQYLQIEEV